MLKTIGKISYEIYVPIIGSHRSLFEPDYMTDSTRDMESINNNISRERLDVLERVGDRGGDNRNKNRTPVKKYPGSGPSKKLHIK